MKNFLALLRLVSCLLFFASFNAYGQLVLEWEKTIGGIKADRSSKVITTADGHYLLAGTSASGIGYEKTVTSRGAEDYWILKITPEGEVLWDQAMGGSGSDQLNAVLNTPDGGFMLAGSSTSGISGKKASPSHGGTDFWLVKTDASGSMLWEKSYGGSADDKLQSIISLPTGGYLLAGYSTSGATGDKSEASRGGSDFWLVRVDAQGDVLWDKTYGGSKEEVLWAITATEEGDFLVGGTSNSPVSGDKSEASRGDQDYWLVRIDAGGELLWDRTLGGSANEGLRAVLATANGDFLIGGFSQSDASGDKSHDRFAEEYYLADIWLLRLDGQGNMLWDKNLGGDGYDVLTTLLPASDGGFLLGAYSTSGSSGYKSENSQGNYDYWLIRVDESGHYLWDKSVGSNGQDILADVIATADEGYLLAGSSSGYPSGDKSSNSRGPSDDFWVVKVQEGYGSPPLIKRPQVMMEWDKTHDDNPGSLRKGTLQKVVATADGGFMLGETSPFRYGSWTDYRIIKLDAAGNWLWEKSYGGNHQESLSALIALPDGGFLLAGYSKSGISLDKTTENKGGEGSPDYWVVRIDAEGNKLWDKTFGSASDDYLFAAVATPDGGFLLAGNSFTYPQGFWLVRIDASGNMLWENTFSSGTSLRALTNAADGNGFLVGSIRGRRDGLGPADYWVLRIDSKGDKMWERTYGGHDWDWLAALAPVADGGFIIGGWSFSNASGEKSQDSRGISDFWIVRIDAAGDIVWEKIYGGNSFEKLVDILATEDGNFVLAGDSRSDISYDKSGGNRGETDYWAIKIDVDGHKLWDIASGGSNFENLVGMAEAADGGFLLAGNSISGISGEKTEPTEGLWLVRFRETSQGILSGGGLFDSPSGAYFPDPFVGGKAYFGLAVHNRDGGKINGMLHFSLREAGLRFRSTEVDWLAVTNKKGMLAGSGVLNQEEGYRFLISVEDRGKGAPVAKDAFRIMIWNPVGRMLYDNQRSYDWDVPSRFEISAGNINIRPFERKKKPAAGKHPLRYNSDIQTVLEGFNTYPIPLDKEGLWLNFPPANEEREFMISIHDMQGRTMAFKTIRLGRAAEQHIWMLNHEHWLKGVYLLRISGNNLLHQQKLLK